ncbi:MAG: hypothetical protein AAGC57_08710 [Pseudomonadota bacterium]
MCRTSELLGQLSEDEQASLQDIARGGSQDCIPDGHAEKLLRLGLAELVCGDQALTHRGKRAAQMLRG